MNDIQTHFEMFLSIEEQERIGATPDKNDSIRVMRLLSAYSDLVFTNERNQATIDAQKKLIRSMSDNACQRESARLRAETKFEQAKMALNWIATVNAMDYEYVKVAREALKKYEK